MWGPEGSCWDPLEVSWTSDRPCEPGVGYDGRVRDKVTQPAVFERVCPCPHQNDGQGLCPFSPQVRSQPQVCPTGDTCSFIRFEMGTGAPQGLP